MIVALVAITNLLLGVAYTGYGIMTAIEMKRDWRTFGSGYAREAARLSRRAASGFCAAFKLSSARPVVLKVLTGP